MNKFADLYVNELSKLTLPHHFIIFYVTFSLSEIQKELNDLYLKGYDVEAELQDKPFREYKITIKLGRR